MEETFLHNPRCSKSREALELLREHNVEVNVREYLSDTPSVAELGELARMLGLRPIDLCRSKEPRFLELGITSSTDDERLLQLMNENPIIIERPIFVRDGRAVIGRPPQRVLDLV